MSWRRLRVLIQHLPPESHTMTALRNQMPAEELSAQAETGEPEKGRWSQEEQLLALIVDSVRQVGYVLQMANTDKKSKKPKPPEPVRRPGAGPRAKKKARLTEASADRLFHLIDGGAA